MASACTRADESPATKPAPPPPRPTGIVLTEIDPASAGIDFVHRNGGSGAKFVPETMGSGLALFDADGDGDLDVYLLQASPSPGTAAFDARSRFYRNEGSFRFRDDTAASGLADAGFAMGVAVADVDNDGDLDVYTSAWGRGHFFRNGGNARFADETDRSGLVAEGFLSSAAFGDLDGDGLADLYVVNYLDDAETRKNPYCGTHDPGGRAYCSPHAFSGAPDFLYRNLGDAKFLDVSRATGIARAGRFDGKGLGVVLSDLDRDGDPDIVVANDSCANFLYRNEGGWKFEEVAAFAGVAFAEDGRERAGMGIDAGDVDGDGWPEILITNLNQEPNSLFRSTAPLVFEDRSGPSRLGPPSVPFVGFGCGLVDLDGDGDRDVLVVNGHILDNAERFGDASPHRQRPLLFENTGDGTFALRSADTPFLSTARVLRGLAFGDLDGDGDPDAIASQNDGPPVLLRNDTDAQGRWVLLRLAASPSKGASLGARVHWWRGPIESVAECRSAFSYLSASASDLALGLGTSPRVDRVRIHWRSGSVTEARDLEPGRLWILHEDGTVEARGLR